MRITKLILLIGLLLWFSPSCIDRYFINADEDIEGKIVINGTITDEGGNQQIQISRSSSPENPKFIPISGCQVIVEDNLGNQIIFQETAGKGHYEAELEPSMLKVGKSFQLKVNLPDGTSYESSEETQTPSPDIAGVYYDLETKSTFGRGSEEDGLQFYIDFEGDSQSGNYYRWKLEETYEYHSTWPINRYLDEDNVLHESGADYSYYFCYKTEALNQIFTLSTEGFSKNSYKKYPLHFVNDHTQRLMYQYSLLVKQYSLSKEAYSYWETLRKNNKEATDLFGKQPANVKGNISNPSNPDEIVLGYFGVSSVKNKRVHVLDVPELSFSEVDYCEAIPLDPSSPIPNQPRPLYMVLTRNYKGELVWGYAGTSCFICTLLGGTTEKPPYWIDE